MKQLGLVTVCLGMLLAMPAWALDLHSARASGSVGEKADGYIAALKSSPEVNALVADVNAKRKAEYARISKQNGQPVDVVGSVAAQEIVNNLPAGGLYQGSDGSWRKR